MESECLLTAAALQDRCNANRALESAHRSPYHSSRIPGITMFDYLRRISKYSNCSVECIVVALIYVDRYVSATQIPVTFRNIHRLIITAVLVAAKIRDDIYFSNAYYASIGGVAVLELNALELDFVKTLRWVTWVEPSEYYAYLNELHARYDQFLAAGTLIPPPATNHRHPPPHAESLAANPHVSAAMPNTAPSHSPTSM